MGEGAFREKLRAEAVLLSQRERELFELRHVRQRTERWLRAFHALSLKLHTDAPLELVACWADLLVGDLSFESACALEVERSTGRLVSAHFDPGPAPRLDALTAQQTTFLAAHPSGVCSAADEETLVALGTALGFEAFFWLSFSATPTVDLLLCAGYSKRTAPFRSLPAHDLSHFLLLGNHLAALLSSSHLFAQVQRERAELAATNERLVVEIRERVRVERELQHAQRLDALGRMAGGLAHEINNPLTAVVSNLQLCLAELEQLGRPSSSEPLAHISASLSDAAEDADRVVRIMHDIAMFATPRVEAPRPVALAPAVETAARIVNNRIRHLARFEQHVDDVPDVLGERRGLEQVLVNLLTNASQSFPERPSSENLIAVRVGRDGPEHVLVEVLDNGAGIPAEHLDRILDPFFTTRDVGQGMGLGLSVCRGILQRFGGELSIQSTVGTGTTARVRLRLAPSERPAPSSERKARLLAIDDEATLLRVLERSLSRRGLTVTTCGSGADALSKYRAGEFDVILCDVMMPEVSGMQVHAALAALGPEHAAKVIFMSGGVFTDEATRYLETSGVPLLRKPCPIDELLRAIEERLHARR